MGTAKVYIIILNYRRWQDSRDCLLSVLQSTYTDFSVFVIDNNSGNYSLEHLVEWFENEIAGKPSVQCEQVSCVLLKKRRTE